MSFIWPIMLSSLVLLPLLAALYVHMQRRRRQIIAQYGTLGFLQTAAGRPLGIRRHIPVVCFFLGLALLLLALARPEAEISLPRIEGTVILAFDVSGSMAADDLDPTRMDAAKAAAQAFVEQQPEYVLIGIVAFSDSGLAVLAPTNDPDQILPAIKRLSPQNGTSLANGIFASLNTIAVAEAEPPPSLYTNLTPAPTASPTAVPEGTYTSAAIVLLTDGENNENPDPLEAAQAAADRGVRIHTVGIGSAAGTILNLDGFSVHTRLDEALLQQISRLTDGEYYNATDEEQLREIYENLDTELALRPEKMEITALVAGASILLLMLGGTFSLLWFGRAP